MSSRFFLRKPALRVALLLGLAFAPAMLIVPGCGGGSSGGGNSSSGNLVRAIGTIALNNGQTGTLNFRINRNGLGQGTFTIANGTVANEIKAAQTTFRPGEYTVGGFFDPETNTITLSGTVSGSGLLTIPVKIPTSQSAGSFTVTILNETFGPAPFTTFVTPTPRPTATATPTATPR